MPIRSLISSIMSQIESEHPELFALQFGKNAKSDLVYTSSFTNINPFPKKPWFSRVCSTSLLKTVWKKEKLLVTSPFSTSFSTHLENFLPFLFNSKL